MDMPSWEVIDEFWSRVEPLIPPKAGRTTDKDFVRKAGAVRKPKPAHRVSMEGLAVRAFWQRQCNS